MLRTLFFIFLTPSLVFPRDEVVETIRRRYEEVKSIHAQVTQVYHWEGFETTQSFHGEIWLSRPDKLRLRLVNGQENHLISCADTAWFYTPGLNQAILAHHPSEVLMEILNFDHYRIEPTVDEEYILNMFLQEENPYFEKITLHIEKKQLLIEQVILTDLNGNRTEWFFHEIEVNPELPDTLFHFAPPSGVEVIEQ